MSTAKQDSRLNFRLPSKLKLEIEEAAAQLGQTVSDFAVSTLARTARRVIQDQSATVLSRKDRAAFMAMLDDRRGTPTKALRKAAKSYKKQVR